MPPVIGKKNEDLSSDEKYEEESFRTKQLFLFAWQIAKGMVITIWLFSEQLTLLRFSFCFHHSKIGFWLFHKQEIKDKWVNFLDEEWFDFFFIRMLN